MKILAYYLPQFHAIPENDEWWGKGFTEWTSVGKAKPLFRDHYQPKVPADLGYYNLLDPKIREEQANLAKEAGVYGFAYWHYWFGEGKQLLEKPFDEVLKSRSPDFPFCLAWANHSWLSKVWSDTSNKKHKLLMEQKYLGKEDNEKHFYAFLESFKDFRYIRHNGMPVFIVYKPLDSDVIADFIKQWNCLIKQNGVAEKFYFIANISEESEKEECIRLGFDAVTLNPFFRFRLIKKYPLLEKIRKRIMTSLFHRPIVIKYSKVVKNFWKENFDSKEDVVPFLLPNWDHSPRSGIHSIVLQNATPKLFEKHALKVLSEVSKKENDLVILKSWNEWGEGNYMEPNLKYGKGYIKALRNAINQVKKSNQ